LKACCSFLAASTLPLTPPPTALTPAPVILSRQAVATDHSSAWSGLEIGGCILMAPITMFHKLIDLKQWRFFSHTLKARSLRFGCCQVHTSSETVGTPSLPHSCLW
jgi:hypothetical protein